MRLTGHAAPPRSINGNPLFNRRRWSSIQPATTQRAIAEGAPVDGYFYWSSQDNLEWNAGFGNRFGLIYVDFDTLERMPKLSAEWFREAARQNAVV